MEILNKQRNINKINKYSLLKPIDKFNIDDLEQINYLDFDNPKLINLLEKNDLVPEFGFSLYKYKNIVLVIEDNELKFIIYINKL